MNNKKSGIVLDDGPWDAWIDGVVESALLEQYKKDPARHQSEVDKWEKEKGRKLGEPTKEELEYIEKAWEKQYQTK